MKNNLIRLHTLVILINLAADKEFFRLKNISTRNQQFWSRMLFFAMQDKATGRLRRKGDKATGRLGDKATGR